MRNVLRRKKQVGDGPGPLPQGASGYLSTTVVAAIANPRRLNTIRNTTRGKAQLDVVKDRAKTDGVGVFVICVDTRGVVALKDGHHRLIYAQEEGIRWLPVTIRHSRGIRSHGKHITEILLLLLRQPDTNSLGSRS